MSNSAAEWREQGIAAARDRDRAGAQAALLQAVALDPQDEHAWFWLAAVQNDPQQTAYYLERVLEINPEHVRARAGLDAVRAQLGHSGAMPPTARVEPGMYPAHPTPATPPTPSRPAPFVPPTTGLSDDAAAALPWNSTIPAAPAPPTSNLEEGLPWGAAVEPANSPAPVMPTTTLGTADLDLPVGELVQLGIEAAQAGRRIGARKALMAAVERDERNADAWYWLSTVVDEREDREISLENALAINPEYHVAREALIALHSGTAPPPPTYERPGSGGLTGLRRPTEAAPPMEIDEAALIAEGEEALFARRPSVTARGETVAERLPRPIFDSAGAAAPTPAVDLPPFVSAFGPEATPAPAPTSTVTTRPMAARPTSPAEGADLSSLRPPLDGPSHHNKPTQVPTSNRVAVGYEGLVGQVIGGRYRVISLFAQGTSTLLMATDVKRGNMVLIRPERDLIGGVRKGVKPTFMANNIAFYMSNIGLGGLNLRNFIGTVGVMPTIQIIEYGLRMCMENKKRGLLLPTRYWSPETLTVDDAGHIAIVVPPDTMDKQVRAGVFSPPEQQAGGTLDGRSDVYLFGAIMFFLATGMPPPAADRLPTPQPYIDSRGRPVSGVVVANFPLFPNLEPLLGGVLATALQADPAARYGSVEQLSAALTGLAGATKGQMQAVPMQRIRGGEKKPNPLMRVLALFGLVIVVSAVILGLVVADQTLNLGALFAGQAGTPLPETPVESVTLAPTPTAEVPTVEAGPSVTVDPAFAPPVAASVDQVRVVQVDARQYPQIVVYCNVLSADGRAVVGLTPDQWAITNNGQAVGDFQYTDLSAQPEPISTFLVMDTSAGMAGTPLDAVKAAVNGFIDGRPPGDSLGLATFNDTAQVVQAFTVGRERVKTGVSGLAAKGGAALWDGLKLGVQQAAGESGRRAIILLSAAPDSASKTSSLDDVMTTTLRSGVPIYVVGLQSATFNPQTLAQVAQQTGGALLTTADPAALAGLYTQVGDRLAAQYRITFTVNTGADKLSRTLRVGVKVGEQAVQDTRQYYVR